MRHLFIALVLMTPSTAKAQDSKEGSEGLMFPMYARYIPSFDASFDAFAADLKKEAEAISTNAEP